MFPIFLQKFSMTKKEKRILYNFSHMNIRDEWLQWRGYGSPQLHTLFDWNSWWIMELPSACYLIFELCLKFHRKYAEWYVNMNLLSFIPAAQFIAFADRDCNDTIDLSMNSKRTFIESTRYFLFKSFNWITVWVHDLVNGNYQPFLYFIILRMIS